MSGLSKVTDESLFVGVEAIAATIFYLDFRFLNSYIFRVSRRSLPESTLQQVMVLKVGMCVLILPSALHLNCNPSAPL